MAVAMAGQAAEGYVGDYSRVAKIRYSHEAMIDQIISNPRITQNELAAVFGYTAPWISRIIGSDAFQAKLAERRAELVNPAIVASVEERLRGLAVQATDVIADKLAATQNPDLALKALEISTKALGFGARERGPAVNNSFVVQLPQQAPSAEAWAAAHAPLGAPSAVSPARVPSITDASAVDAEVVSREIPE